MSLIYRSRFGFMVALLLSLLGKEPLFAQETGQDFFDKGTSAFEKQNYKKAIKYFSDAIKLKPEYGEAFWQRAKAYYENKNLKEAIEDYTKAIVIYKDSAAIQSTLFTKRGKIYDEQEKYDEAIADYNSAIALNKENGEAVANRGIAYLDNDKYQLGFDDFSTSVKFYKDDHFSLSSIYSNRATCLRYLRKYDQALEDFNLSLKINPDNGSAFWGMAIAFEMKQEYDDAIHNYTQAMKYYLNNPKSLAILYRNRGYNYYKSGTNSKALMDLNRAIEINPKYGSAYRRRALLYLNQLNDPEKAKSDFEKLSTLDSVPTYFTGFGKFYLGKNDEVTADIKTILARPSTKVVDLQNAYYDVACLYAITKNETEALQYLEKAFDKGWHDFDHLKVDEDLDALRKSDAFKALVARYDKG